MADKDVGEWSLHQGERAAAMTKTLHENYKQPKLLARAINTGGMEFFLRLNSQLLIK